MRLTKEQSRNRWQELNNLALEWDPFGVTDGDGPQDEYACIVELLLRHLEAGATEQELLSAFEAEWRGHFGMSRMTDREVVFVARTYSWFQERWPGSTV